MTFTSFNFLFFFPAVIIIFYALPYGWRWKFILFASYFFYISLKPVYAAILIGITIITYLFPILIEKAVSQKRKKKILIYNVILILLPLVFFKYFDVINTSLVNLLKGLNLHFPFPEIPFFMPLGISYYTFMSLSYSIDVYNEEIGAEKKFGIVALFLAFFPTVLSGPIERAGNMFPQFKSTLEFNYDKFVYGLQLMLWGYFMKFVIANRIGVYNKNIFDNTIRHNGHSVTVAVLLYPIQVYADLAGYSFIAIGAARVMGIDVMQNFKRPFFATSMSAFWRRWHISLIKWLTDYIYMPLSYSFRKYKMAGIVTALMITFIISGIWHGAALTFVIWGTLQGIFLSVEAITNKNKKAFVKTYNLGDRRWYLVLSCLFTYILFAFSEIFGGAVANIHSVLLVIKKIFLDFQGPVYSESPSTTLFLIFGISLLFLAEIKEEFFSGSHLLVNSKNVLVRHISYSVIIMIILLAGVFDESQFIYFQF